MNNIVQKLAEFHNLDINIMQAIYDDMVVYIVQECLNQCYYRGMNDELYVGQLKAADYIEQHFGMKE